MKVSKKSWHYKLNSAMENSFEYKIEYHKYTTCSYFWRTVASILWASLMFLMAGITLFFVLKLFFSVFYSIGALIFGYTVPDEVLIYGLGGFIIVIAPVAIYGIGKAAQWLMNKACDTVKKPGPFISYWKSRKAKVCSIVELENE